MKKSNKAKKSDQAHFFPESDGLGKVTPLKSHTGTVRGTASNDQLKNALMKALHEKQKSE